jgi:hypothetical protein
LPLPSLALGKPPIQVFSLGLCERCFNACAGLHREMSWASKRDCQDLIQLHQSRPTSSSLDAALFLKMLSPTHVSEGEVVDLRCASRDLAVDPNWMRPVRPDETETAPASAHP